MDEFVTVDDGCRLRIRCDGEARAPVLMLSNALGTTLDMWAPQVAAFSRRFRLLRYDSRGHGRSDAPAGDYSIERLGRDAVALLDALGVGTAQFVRLSMGGMVGQWLAANAPGRIERAVFASTTTYIGNPAVFAERIARARADGMAGLVEGTIERWFTPAFRASHPAEVEPIREMLRAADPIGYAGACAAVRDMDLREDDARIALPVLVIGGTADPGNSVAQSRALAEAIRGSRLRLMEAAHLCNVEQAEAFTAAVLDFLD